MFIHRGTDKGRTKQRNNHREISICRGLRVLPSLSGCGFLEASLVGPSLEVDRDGDEEAPRVDRDVEEFVARLLLASASDLDIGRGIGRRTRGDSRFQNFKMRTLPESPYPVTVPPPATTRQESNRSDPTVPREEERC